MRMLNAFKNIKNECVCKTIQLSASVNYFNTFICRYFNFWRKKMKYEMKKMYQNQITLYVFSWRRNLFSKILIYNNNSIYVIRKIKYNRDYDIEFVWVK